MYRIELVIVIMWENTKYVFSYLSLIEITAIVERNMRAM